MRHLTLIACGIAAAAVVSLSSSGTGAASAQASLTSPQAQTPPPRSTTPPKPTTQPKTEPTKPTATPRPSPTTTSADPQKAKPRPTTTPAPPPKAEPRRPAPPSRELPPRYYGSPRVYFFPPISMHRDYYYHPYFGFYFGPYYGPFYPYPGPYFGPTQYSASALRLKVKPVTTQVYVDGYYAGAVDDFDGIFQRLYLPAGEHQIDLVLTGYRTYRQALYLNPGDTQEIAMQMQPLRPGERQLQPLRPQSMTADATIGGAALPDDRPLSPFGVLTLHIEPPDAQVMLDGEVWLATEGRTELVIHVPAGSHQLEVRKEGFMSFSTGIELSEGGKTRLDVRLVR